MRHKGFTLIEAVISVAIFGVLMAILFGVFNHFNKAWLKSYAKQEINVKFLRIYKSVSSDISLTNSKFFHDYNKSSQSSLGSHWFLFPSVKSEKGSFWSGEDEMPGTALNGDVMWNRVIVYHLAIPKGDKCKTSDGFNLYCPHKQLVRHVLRIGLPLHTTEFGEITVNDYMGLFVKKVPDIIQSKANSVIVLGPEISATVLSRNIVESDVLELSVDSSQGGRIKFNLKLLRIADAEKNITIRNEGGNQTKLLEKPDLSEGLTSMISTDAAKRYIEETSWLARANN